MPQLTWLGDAQAKRTAQQVPYRLLETLSQHGEQDSSNWLIQGDNLDALKALLPFYAGRVKCIFIDPPYNTKSAFEHYDDNLEHGQWLSMMYPRLELLRELLAEDGSIWITLDDNESHYLKVLTDEIFGRNNFLGNVIWNHSVQSKGYSGKLSVHHNHLLGYRRSTAFKLDDLPRMDEHNINYSNPDNDPRGAWRAGDVRNSLVRPNLMYDIQTPSGKLINHPPKGWRFSRETFERELAEGKIMFSADESRIIRKIYLEDQTGRVPETLWFAQDVGTTREANKEVKAFVESDSFETPKPERLIQRILHIATNPGDLVLDSFLGSGTTAAVAHKMGRRWIGIEMGEHAQTHCLPRLQKVVNGEQGGISQAVNWQGGGGFHFVRLGEPVFQADGSIHPQIRFATLARYVWFLENRAPHSASQFDSPLLGIVGEGESAVAYVLLYNGILGDRRANGGNVLTSVLWPYLQSLAPEHRGRWVIYGEASRMPESRRRTLHISFKQIPYDIRMK
ncbi:site-specific DNA-methyltransferase [Pseudomonas fluvialis]|uniref:site-specific DNA-methyltransferase n=1 Tax=Pseudomonas fluvialis TaxID=1793966 RepID=UPI0035B12134